MRDEMKWGQVQRHLTGLVPEREAELRTMETHAEETGFPIVGPVAGQLCYQIARMIGARRVFELGSGFGYSTAWFARAVRENGGGEVYKARDTRLDRMVAVKVLDGRLDAAAGSVGEHLVPPARLDGPGVEGKPASPSDEKAEIEKVLADSP